jgi:hypothetical protein
MPRNKTNFLDEKRIIPLDWWTDYLDLPETPPEEMTVGELLVLKRRLMWQLDKVEKLIERKNSVVRRR